MKRLMECSLEQLIALEPSLEASSFEGVYCRVLILYLQSAVPSLKALRDRFVSGRAEFARSMGEKETAFLLAMTDLRLQIRERSVSDEGIETALRAAGSNPLWSGEAAFVSALAYDVLDQHELCCEYNWRALNALREAGVQRKALFAHQNAVAAESRQYPERNLLLSYYQIYRTARTLRERGVAGIVLNNMAREYQLMGALNSALRAVNRALVCLQEDSGTIHFFLALLNRCHILLQLNRKAEARVDFESARLATFKEVQGALKVLGHHFGTVMEDRDPPESDLQPTWRERAISFARGQGAPSLAVQEDQLVRHLASGPMKKEALFAALFDRGLSHEVLENRLKSLLRRIERKRPGLVTKKDGEYLLAGGEALSSIPVSANGVRVSHANPVPPDLSRALLFAELHSVYRWARKRRDLPLAARALQRIAFEYERLGALAAAARYSRKAEALTSEDVRKPLVQAAVRLTPLEAKVMELLAEGSKDRFELMEALYGNSISLGLLENRLKNLLSRLKAKCPGQIIFENGKYRLVAEAVAQAG